MRLTRELYDYAIKHGKLKYKDLRDIRDIKLDTAHWGERTNALPSLTHALQL